jgi:sarcosine oxidase, subunit alpha
MRRLPPPFGNRIDRSRPLRFTFEGRCYAGFAGDSIASALAANGQSVLSRSFKYHRPRGIHSLVGTDANTLVQLADEPNLAADLTALEDGMVVSAQNVNGSLDRDRDEIHNRLGRFLPVGFYYRTFMGPTRHAWLKVWEPLLRRKAGLGKINKASARATTLSAYLHCQILVVGGGPAGLSAAIEAAAGGADVLLCEAEPALGGSLTYRDTQAAPIALVEKAQTLPNLRLLTDARCNGWFEDNWLPLIRGNALYRVRAKQLIVAAGTIEQPAVFRNNDLPGIMTGGTVRRLVCHYGVLPGTQAVVLAATPEGYQTARTLTAAGVKIAAVIEPRPLPADYSQDLRHAGVEVLPGRIEEARGRLGVTAIRVGPRWIDCDLVAVSAGHMPAWQLPCQAGAKLVYDNAHQEFHFTGLPPSIHLAGSIAGHAGHETVIADGRRAAQAALRQMGTPASELAHSPEDADRRFAGWAMPLTADPRGRDFVDLDEDLQVMDLVHAVQEGYRDIELVKRFTTVGMGPSQGKHSALATARIVAAATGRGVGETGITTARPPVAAEKLGVLAGHHGGLERRTSLHNCHLALGAEMKPVSNWWRPAVYAKGQARPGAIAAEVKAVRDAAGLLDVSTLGKLEVRGPSAAAFLDRIYSTAHGNQPPGRVRYALMLNEMGTVIDDGVVLRLPDDCFYVTATTGAIARVYADLTFWNAQWRMDVDVLNLTSAFCALNVTGPAARAVLEAIEGDIDFSQASFPYLEGRIGTVAGVPVRAMRIGFTGEVSFELHCPGSHALTLWGAIVGAGTQHGLRPYGLEASRILRLEKSHILIGQDTDAMTSPDELGFGWAVSKKKPFYIGRRSVEMRRRAGLTRRLVGLTFPAGPDLGLGEGCLVLRAGSPAGHITSYAHSPSLGHPIALAYVHPADSEAGSIVTLRARNGNRVTGTVTAHAFFDPNNSRQER